ncbi:MAG: bifunctional metallophosphatase/5'-nucleotidase [Draconibacterium sp.]|nr:bifunctional metallophosphatase/5'-nucleotidase [Draconibacterium sp.]
MKTIFTTFFILLIFIFGCTKDNQTNDSVTTNLTIFFVNDVHGQIENFSKVKHIVDAEREKTNVMVVSSGDLFSGNPAIDNYTPKGYPIIDIMNQIGFDIAVLGNHEFDYGIEMLSDRIEQSQFPWVCANVNTNSSQLTQPPPFATLTIDNLKITFLGLIETGGSNSKIIPSSHPGKIDELTFYRAQNIVTDFKDTKTQEDADLFIALSHLGIIGFEDNIGDFELAQQNFFFDMIIGGHTHAKVDTTIANIPVFQAGSYLHSLGKIELTVKNRSIQSVNYNLINLDNYTQHDNELKATIETYNDLPELKEVIGYSYRYHSRWQLGCFYTDAMRLKMDVDVAFQNTGGIRTGIDEGNITKREIYEISPFNNGTIIFEMTVAEIKQFFIGSRSGFYYSGIQIRKVDGKIEIRDLNNRKIPDNYILTVGINDYIPAVNDMYFPDNGVVQPLTAAETLIAYLTDINREVDYPGCNRYFRY